jgi:hypothetical protein
MNHRREAIDVNLLRVLYAVLTERSVTRAAGKLGQSQPAISLTVSQIGCALYFRTGREPSLHEPQSKQDAQRSNGIRNVTLSALDCPEGCNPWEAQAACVQGSFFYCVRLIAS